MKKLVKLDGDAIYGLCENFFDEIGRKWTVIAINDEQNERTNLMTASWVQTGILWNKPVCTLYIREQRHSFSLAEREEKFALMFFDEKYKNELVYFGTKSGKDEDKLASAGMTPCTLDGVGAVCEANIVFVLKKLYCDYLKEDAFCDKAPLSNYESKDFHKFYICEIESVYKAE